MVSSLAGRDRRRPPWAAAPDGVTSGPHETQCRPPVQGRAPLHRAADDDRP
jgi:hypothetical protein